MYTKSETRKSENQTPPIKIMDCTKHEKLVLRRSSDLAILAVEDNRGHCIALMPLQLKAPFAKNYAKFAQTLLTIGDLIVEEVENRGSY